VVAALAGQVLEDGMSGPRWEVQIVNPADGKPKRWDVYDNRARAESAAATLRHHKFWVRVRRVDGDEFGVEKKAL
jgi:hypothetical protein